MPYAFISHRSACEALRTRELAGEPWPDHDRFLPRHGDCIRLQHELAELEKKTNLVRLGIASTPIDLLVPSSLMRTRGKRIHTHGWVAPLPAGSMRRVADNVLVSSPEFVILQLAHSHVRRDPLLDKMIDLHLEERQALCELGIDVEPPYEDLVWWAHAQILVTVAQIAMEFAGSYRLATPLTSARFNRPRIMTIGSALDFIERTDCPSDSQRARKALRLAANGSASPMETALFLMLTLPTEMGGFGLPKPELNADSGVVLHGVHLRPDLMWRLARVVVEYDSSEFHSDLGRDKTDRDIERANALRAAGFTVLETTPGIVSRPASVATLAEQIASLVGVSLRETSEEQRRTRERLMRTLLTGQQD